MKCSWCNGDGGETDVILDDGTGPWEPCGLCRETGKVNLWIWLMGHYWNIESWFRYDFSRPLKKYWFSRILCLFGFHVFDRFSWVKEHHCWICHKKQKESK